MTYQEFNRRVFHFYLARAQGDYCYLSLDDHDVSRVTDGNGIPVFPALADSWRPLLNNDQAIPSYFGLIGIQCHAAFLMKDDKDHSARAYKSRLRQVMGLPKVDDLQPLFAEGSEDLSIQEEIWTTAKLYLKAEQGLSLEIPACRRYAGRFTQYPTSQCLLNMKDIHRLTLFFDQHFEVGESIPFSYFEKVFNSHRPNIDLTPHAKEVLTDPMKFNNALRQLFASFTSWTGQVYSPPTTSTPKNGSPNSRQTSGVKRLLLIFHQDKPAFYEEDTENKNFLREISAMEISLRKSRQWVDGNTLFFQPMEYFQDEYEASRFFYPDKSCYVLIDTTIDSASSRYLQRSSQTVLPLTDTLLLYHYEVGKQLSPRCFVRYEGLQQAVSLSGGLRISRGREYLAGFGPSIISPDEHFVFQHFKRLEYVPEQAGPGTYIVRVAGMRDTTFTIVERCTFSEPLPATDYGWNISLYRPEQNPTIEGCLFHDPVGGKEENLTRQWISRLTGATTKPYRGRHSLLRMLNHIK